ncbi:unnamed protein product [Peniophora sp. CBMAI 1063]|nr:unnamed protein product [Peniophora sp. CBMAI 1063]
MTRVFSQILVEGPTSAIEHLRALYAAQRSSTPDEELVSCIQAVAHRLCAPAKDGTLFSGELWRACISSELLILLLEIIGDPFFTSGPEFWVASVLLCLNGILEPWWLYEDSDPQYRPPEIKPVLPEQGQLEHMFSVLRPAWQNLWDHIDDLLDPTVGAILGTPAHVLALLASMTGDMLGLCGLYRNRIANTEDKMRVLLDVEFIPVMLFTWTHSNLCGGPGHSESLHEIPLRMDEYRASIEEVATTLAEGPGGDAMQVYWNEKVDKAIARIGPPKIIEAFRIILEESGLWLVDKILISHLKELSLLLSTGLAHHTQLREAFWEQPMTAALHAVCMRAYRQTMAHQGARHFLAWCKHCCDLLGVVGEGVARGFCTEIYGSHLGIMFSNFCVVGVSGLPTVFEGDETQVETLDELCSSLCTVTTRWCEVIRESSNGHDVNPDVERLVLQLRLSSEKAWYPTLQAMRLMQDTMGRESKERTGRYIQCWVDLGNTLGLDEMTERVQFEASRTRLCSWRACAYYRECAKEALPVCKGCGAARYCSRECQRKDWKEGNHKMKCRRLKT